MFRAPDFKSVKEVHSLTSSGNLSIKQYLKDPCTASLGFIFFFFLHNLQDFTYFVVEVSHFKLYKVKTFENRLLFYFKIFHFCYSLLHLVLFVWRFPSLNYVKSTSTLLVIMQSSLGYCGGHHDHRFFRHLLWGLTYVWPICHCQVEN